MKAIAHFLIILLLTNIGVAGETRAAGREPVLSQVKVSHSYYWREMYVPHVTNGPSGVDWTADGESLIYSMQGRLWRQRIGETRAVALTSGTGYDFQPDVSPDGRRVAFSRYENDAYEVMTLELSSGRLERVTANRAVNVDPRWAPDSRRLAYVSTEGAGRFHIAIATPGPLGWSSVRWAPERESATPRYYYDRVDHELSPVWSPDGDKLAFVANPEVGYGTGSIFVQKVDRSEAATLLVAEETAWKARPDWSPDGRRVAYSSFAGRQWHQLWMTPASPGGYPLAFSYGEFDVTSVRWSPDGKRLAFISNETGDGAIVIQEVVGGARRRVTVETRVGVADIGGLAFRVLDEKGRPTPARVSVRGADGRFHAPDDALIHADDYYDRALSASEPQYFHSTGEGRLSAPAGTAVVTVWRGLRHAPAQVSVVITPGETATIDITPELLPLAERFSEWRSGDVHVHMNYGGAYRMTPDRLAAQADAEDLDFAFNLIVNKEQRIPDIDAFTTEPLTPAGREATILQGQEYHTSVWGHMGLLGLKSHYLLGDYVGYPKTALSSLYPDNGAVSALARAQEGLVGYVHPFDPPAPDPAASAPLSNAFPADAILGALDYVEVVGFSDHRTTADVWTRLLNLGVRLPAAGGSDTMANYASLRGPVGVNRTYVWQEPGAPPIERVDGFLAALKAGRTLATNGPLIDLVVNGQRPGSEIRLGDRRGVLRLEAVMTSAAPVDRFEIVVNGQPAVRVPLSNDRRSGAFEGDIQVDGPAWIVARAVSDVASPLVFDLYPFATTSPVYVATPGAGLTSTQDADFFIAWIAKLKATAEAGEYNTAEERKAVLDRLDAAARAFEARR